MTLTSISITPVCVYIKLWRSKGQISVLMTLFCARSLWHWFSIDDIVQEHDVLMTHFMTSLFVQLSRRYLHVACWTAGQQVKLSILRLGMIHYKIHLICPGCPRPITVQNCDLMQHLFHFISSNLWVCWIVSWNKLWIACYKSSTVMFGLNVF